MAKLIHQHGGIGRKYGGIREGVLFDFFPEGGEIRPPLKSARKGSRKFRGCEPAPLRDGGYIQITSGKIDTTHPECSGGGGGPDGGRNPSNKINIWDIQGKTEYRIYSGGSGRVIGGGPAIESGGIRFDTAFDTTIAAVKSDNIIRSGGSGHDPHQIGPTAKKDIWGPFAAGNARVTKNKRGFPGGGIKGAIKFS